MSLLNFSKTDDIKKLQAQLSATNDKLAACRADRADTRAALADVEQRLATAVIEDDASAAALSVERARLAEWVVAIDLGIARGDADADSLRLQIAASTDRAERVRVAKLLEAQAVELEKAVAPALKAVQALAAAYGNSSRSAVQAMPGATPQTLAHAFEWIPDFLKGHAIDALVASLRQTAGDVVDGRRDPAEVTTTINGQFEAWGLAKRVG